MGQVVDDRYFPLVVCSFPAQLDGKFVELFISEADGPILRRQPHVTLIDFTRLRELPNAVVRKGIGEWAKTREDVVRQHVLGTAFLLTSPLARGALTAILWLAPATYPMEVVATHRDAIRFLQGCYERRCGPSPVFERYERASRSA